VQLTAATAIERPRWLLPALLVLALRNVVGFPSGSVNGARRFYRRRYNTAVTLLRRC
jgi:hypothetical protein